MKKVKQFKVIVEQDEDGYFVAAVPELPGCYTQAKTLPELRKRVKEAIQLCLEVRKIDPQYKQCVERLKYQPVFVGLEAVEV